MSAMSPADFKRFVLYFAPKDHNSVMAINMAKKMSEEIWLQNVMDMPPGNRPAWLNVVPLLVENKTQLIYRGIACLEKLREVVSSNFDAWSTSTAKGASAFELDDPLAPTMATMYDQSGGRRIDQAELDMMMRLRTKQDERQKTSGAAM